MADSSVLLEVIVEGKNIKLVQRQVEELAGSVNKTSTATDANTKSSDKNTESKKKATKSGRELYKNQQGVAQNTANGTKAFAKQAQGIGGGLVPAYAALAANVFALTALFGALQRAAALEQLEAGLIATGAAAGQNLPAVAESLKRITDNALSTKDAFEATALATSAGFSTVQLERLTGVAKGASLALGRDLSDALGRLVRGTAKLEPEILDELGIMVRLDEAARVYGRAIGKTALELTQFEKQQAFLNATLDQGEKKFGSIAEKIDPNPYNQLSAAFQDLSKELFKIINTVVTPFVQFLSMNSFALTGALFLFGTTVAKSVIPALTAVAATQAEIAVSASAAAKKAGTALGDGYARKVKDLKKTLLTVPDSFERMIPSIKKGTATIGDMKKGVRQLSAAEGKRTKAINEATKANKSTEVYVREKNEIIATKNALKALIAEENKRKPVASGINLEGQARSAKALSGTMERMDKATTITGKLKVAVRGAGLQFKIFTKTLKVASKSTGKLNVALIGLKSGFRAAAAGAKILGAAVLNAIPIIGQVIFAASMLYEAFSWLWADTKVQTALKELDEQFKEFTVTALTLEEALKNPKLENAEKNKSTLAVQIGLIDQLAAGFVALQKAQKEQFAEEIAGYGSTLVALERRENARRNVLKSQGREGEIKTDPIILALAGQKLRAQRDLDNARKESTIVGKKQSLELIDGFLGQIKASDTLTRTMGAQAQTLNGLRASINNNDKPIAEIIKEVMAIGTPLQRYEAATNGLVSGFGELGGELVKFNKKGKTSFDPILSKLQEIGRNTASIQGKGLIEDKEAKKLTMYAEGFAQIFDSIEAGSEGAFQKGIKAAEKQRNLIVSSKEQAAKLTAEAKFYGTVSTKSAGLAQQSITKQIDATNQLILGEQALLATKKIANIEARAGAKKAIESNRTELKSAKKENDGTEKAKARIETATRAIRQAQENLVKLANDESVTQNKIASLKLGQKTSADVILAGVKAEVASGKEKLALDTKLNSLLLTRAKVASNIAKETLALQRAEAGSGLTAEDEYNLAKAASKLKSEAEQASFNLRKRGIELENKLLQAKNRAEQMRLENIIALSDDDAVKIAAKNQLATTIEIGKVYADIAASTIATAVATEEARVQTEKMKEAGLLESKNRQDIALSLRATEQSASRISMLSSGTAGTLASINVVTQKRAQAQKDLAALMESEKDSATKSQALKSKALEVESLITEELGLQLKLISGRNKQQTDFLTKSLSSLKSISKARLEIEKIDNTNPYTGEVKSSAEAFKISQRSRTNQLAALKAQKVIQQQIMSDELYVAKIKANQVAGSKNISSEIKAATKKDYDQKVALNELAMSTLAAESELLSKKFDLEARREAVTLAEKASKDAGGVGVGVLSATRSVIELSKPKEETPFEKKLASLFDGDTNASEVKILSSIYESLERLPDALATAITNALSSMPKGVATTVSPTAAKATPVTEGVSTQGSNTSDAIQVLDTSVTDIAAPKLELQTEEAKLNLQDMRLVVQGFAADLSSLGPEGVAMSAFVNGGLSLVDGMNTSIASFDKADTASEKSAAVLAGVGSAIGAIGAMSAAASQQKIAGIDQEIQAEKNRDGKSKESLAKIAQLEAKKEKMKRKAFEQDKKMKMAQTVINTAAAMMATVGQTGFAGWPMAIMLGAFGAAQLAMISGMTYAGGGSGAGSGGVTSIGMGERSKSVDLAKSQSSVGELAYARGAQGTGGPENFTPTNAFMGAKYRAAGGPTTGYIVGEQGPELFVPETPGRIVPEGESAAQAPMNVNFSINTIDASGVEDILTSQQGNIIGMVRSAANQYGQPFLEGVDTGAYTQSAGGVKKY